MHIPKFMAGGLMLLVATAQSGHTQISDDKTTEAARDISVFEVQRPVMAAVDAYFGRNELAKTRARNAETDVPLATGQMSTFADQIGQEIARHLQAAPVDLSNITAYYAVDARPPNQTYSLTERPLCISSREVLANIFRKNAKLIDEEVQLAQAFEAKANDALEASTRDPSNIVPLSQTWGALAGCLAYAESLGDADGASSLAEAQRRLGSDFQKPPGVKVYYDRWHSSEESRLNLGLYQFVLTKGGNTFPCLKAWEELNLTASSVISNYDQEDMAHFVGSSGQSFNAFCGINKIVQSLYVTAYTHATKETHPNNINSDGSLKPPAERCISPFHGGAYSHFSPLTRGYVYSDAEYGKSGNRSNFHKVMQCTMEVLGR